MLHLHSIFAHISICLLSIYCVNSNVIEPVKPSDKVGFSWGNCGTGGDPVQFKVVSIAPDPIRFPGDVEVALSVNLVKPFPPDLTALVVMEKDVLGLWVKVPCVNNVGSCVYQDLCTNITHLYFNPFQSLDTDKKCPPIPAGTYSMANVILPISKSIPSIADGTMRVTIDFLSNALGQLGCLQMIVNLT